MDKTVSDPMQDADRILALEKKATPGPWENDTFLVGTEPAPPHIVIPHDRGGKWFVTMRTRGDGEFIVALRNSASAVIRALMERVKEMELSSKGFMIQDIPNLYARIAHLEAERDIWRERAQGWVRTNSVSVGPSFTDLTPEEIVARVEQNRKGRQE